MSGLRGRGRIAACTVALSVATLGAAVATTAPAHAATPIYSEDFADGLGTFASTGYVVTNANGAVLRGSRSTPGSLTSAPISLAGATDVSVSYERTASGLDANEAFTAAYSVDGGAFVALESVQTPTGATSFDLPATVDGKVLRLRFAVRANSILESAAVDDVLVAAGEGGTEPPPPGEGSLPPVTDVTRPGPYAVTIDQTSGPGNGGWLIHPTNLGADGVKHPVFVWGPGATTGPQQYQDMLRQWASHGFVIYSKPSTNDGAWMRQGLDWLIAENGRAGSVLNGKLDTTEAAFGGHSLGSIGTFAVASDPRLSTTIHVAGGSFDGQGSNNLRKPALYIGGDGDLATPNAERDYTATRVPVWFNILRGTDHFAATRNGQHIITAWLRWHLADEEFRRTQDFLSPTCTFCNLGQTRYKNW